MKKAKTLLFLLTLTCTAMSYADIGSGLAWLKSRQNIDGNWAQTLRETGEAVRTLSVLGDTGIAIRDGAEWFAQAEPSRLDEIAFQLFIGSECMVGVNATYLQSQILALQAGALFRYDANYKGTTWHTMLALQALQRSGYYDRELYGNALLAVTNVQRSDGSWGFTAQDDSRLAATVKAIELLHAFASWNLPPRHLNNAVAWLLAKQNFDGGFGENGSTVFETAICWQVLRDLDLNWQARLAAAQFLESRQSFDGSWNGSVIESAMALRALGKSGTPNLVARSTLIDCSSTVFSGSTANIRAGIVNLGDAVVSSFNVRLYDGDSLIADDLTISALAPEDTGHVTTPWIIPAGTGPHTLRVMADPDDAVAESNELDNEAAIEVTARDTTRPDTAGLWVSEPYFSPNGNGVKDTTTAWCNLSEPCVVRIEINDTAGGFIRQLCNAQCPAGLTPAAWDGRNEAGAIVIDGEYTISAMITDADGNMIVRSQRVTVDNNRSSVLDGRRGWVKVLADSQNIAYRHYPSYDNNFLVSPNEDRIILRIDPEWDDTSWTHWRQTDIATLRYDGSGYGMLSNDTLYQQRMTLSPDGRLLAFAEAWGDYDQRKRLCIADMETGRQTKFAEEPDMHWPYGGYSFSNLAWSSAGDLLYLRRSYNPPDYTDPQLWVVPAGDTVQTVLSNPDPQWGVNWTECAKWSPSGNWILYDQDSIRLVSKDGQKRATLDGWLDVWAGGCWRPGTDEVAYWGNDSELWLMDVTTMSKRLLPAMTDKSKGRGSTNLIWSPDGLCLAEMSSDRIMVHNVETSKTTYYNFIVPEYYNISLLWSPDSKKLYTSLVRIGEKAASVGNGDIMRPGKNELAVISDRSIMPISLDVLKRSTLSKEMTPEEIVINLSDGSVQRFPGFGASSWSHNSRYLLTTGNIQVFDAKGSPVTTILPDTIYANEMHLSRDMTDIVFVGSYGWYLGKAHSLNNLRVDISGIARNPVNTDIAMVIGTITDRNLDGYKLEYGLGEQPAEWQLIDAGTREAEDDTIAQWTPAQTGYYTLRLTAWDKAGNIGRALKTSYWVCNPVIADIKLQPKFISPNGDGVQDTTVVSYTLVKPEPVSFRFYDNFGYLARTVTMYPDSLGLHKFGWDGRDEGGLVLPEGASKMVVEGAKYSLLIDTTAPKCNISGQPVMIEGSWQHLAYSLGWSAYDNSFRNLRVDYGDGPNPAQWFTIVESDKFTGNLFLDSTVVYGTYTFRLTAQDLAGNISTKTFTTNDSLVAVEPSRGSPPTYTGRTGDTVRVPVIGFASGTKPDSVLCRIIPDTVNGLWQDYGLMAELQDCRQFYLDTLHVKVDSINIRYKAQFYGWRWDSMIVSDTVSFIVKLDSIVPPDSMHYLCIDSISGLNDTVSSIHVKIKGFKPNNITLSYRTQTWDAKDTIYIYGPWIPVAVVPCTSSHVVYKWNIKEIVDSNYQLRGVAIDPLCMVEYEDVMKFEINSRPFIRLIKPPKHSSDEGPTVYHGRVPMVATAWPSNRTLLRGGEIDRIVFEDRPFEDYGIILETTYEQTYELNWDSRIKYPDDDLYMSISAVAVDNFGNSNHDGSDFCVNNKPPLAAITYPTLGQVISNDTISVIGSADDLFFVKYALSYRAINDSSWTPIKDTINRRCARNKKRLGYWKTGCLLSGAYFVKLQVWDQDLDSEDSVRVILQTDNPFPEAMIFSPVAGEHLRDTVPVTGIARDSNLLCWKLQFGGTKLDSSTVNAAGLLKYWDTRNVRDTAAYLHLHAEDISGLIADDSCMVTVDNTLPIVDIYLYDSSYISRPVAIAGIATDTNFARYLLEIGAGDQPQAWLPLMNGLQPVHHGTLGSISKYQLTNGWHVIRLTAKDSAGNVNQIQRLVNIDTIPPVPPTGLQAKAVKRSVQLTWNSNTEPDLAGYHVYRLNNRIDPDSISLISSTYLDSVFADGWYSYRVSAYDRAGLESKKSDSVRLYIDVTPPFVAIGEPPPGARVHGSIEIRGAASDNNFSQYRLEYRPASDTTAWSEIGVSQLPVSFGLLGSLNTLLLNNDSSYVIRLTANDTYGNGDTAQITVMVDNAPPAAPSGLTANAANDTVKLGWDANTEPDLAGYLAYRETGLVSPLVPAGTTRYADRNVPDGLHVYYLIAVDSAGNRSQPSAPVPVDIDNRWPAAVIKQPLPGTLVNGAVSVSAEAIDQDLAWVVFQFKPAAESAWQGIASDSSLPYRITWNTDGLAFGDYDLRAIATDFTGHTDPAPAQIRVRLVRETQPPAAPSGLIARGHRDTIYLAWSANQEPDLAGYNVYINGNKINTALIAPTALQASGYWNDYHRCQISAVDTVGNESPRCPAVVTDMVPPDVAIIYPNQYEGLHGTIQVKGTVRDSMLELYSVEYGAGGAPSQWIMIQTDSVPIVNGVLTRWSTDGLNGEYSLRLRAIDRNDYSSETVVSCLWVDNQSPPAPRVTVVRDSVWADSSLVNVMLDSTDTDQTSINLYFSEQALSGYNLVRMIPTDIPYNTGWRWQFRVGNLMPLTTYYFKATVVDCLNNESDYSNIDSISMGAGYCDLAVYDDSISIIPSYIVQGDTVNVRAVICNIADVPLRNVPVKVYAATSGPYQQIGNTQTINLVMPQNTVELTVPWHTAGWAGNGFVFVQVNPDQAIYESDFSNNQAAHACMVRSTAFDGRLTTAPDSLLPGQSMLAQVMIKNTGAQRDTARVVLSLLDTTGRVLNLSPAGDTLNAFDSGRWIDDSLPGYATPSGNWIWDSATSFIGKYSHSDISAAGVLEHGFSGSPDTLFAQPGQSIIQYVYLDAINRPRQIMLEFMTADSNREHRAYWGENLIDRGYNNTWSRKRIGNLPVACEWVRLDIPAREIGLEGAPITGISYILYDGKANWDKTCLGLNRFSTALDQGDSAIVSLAWYNANHRSGNYEVSATLFAGNNSQRFMAPFVIRGIPGLTAHLSTEQASYTAGQTVQIATQIRNYSPNLTYTNLQQRIQVIDSSGLVWYDTARTVAQLAPGASVDACFAWNSGTAPANAYSAKQLIIGQNGDTLSDTRYAFSLNPIPGGSVQLAGWTGAAPRQVVKPDGFGMYWKVKNNGQIAADTSVLRLSLMSPDSGFILDRFIDTVYALQPGQSRSDTHSVSTSAIEPGSYPVILELVRPDTTILLAYGGITINAPVAPKITETAPQAGSYVRGSIPVTARASSVAMAIDSVVVDIDSDRLHLPRISGDSLNGVYVSSYLTTGLADGLHHLVFSAWDKAGHAAQPVDNVVTTDNTAPGITISSITDSSWYNAGVAPIITVSEANPDSQRITLNGQPFTSGTLVDAEDEYLLSAWAKDKAGNSTTRSVLFGIDTTAPAIAISGVSDGGWYDQAVIPAVTITEAHVESTATLLDGSPYVSGTAISAEGQHQLSAYVRDKAGNSAQQSYTFTIDSSKPVIMITGVSDGVWYNAQVTPVVAITDSNLDSSAITLNGQTFTSGEVVNLDGSYTLEAFGRDRAGNTDSVRLTFHIDKTSPVITVSGISDGAWYDHSALPVVSITDANLDSSSILLDGVPFVSGSTVSSEGRHLLTVWAIDKTGNIASDTVSFGIDITVPVIAISGVAEGAWYNHGVTPNVTVTEAYLDSQRVTLNGQPFASGTQVNAGGEYLLTAWARDSAGNAATCSVQFGIDLSAPVIAISGVAHGGWYNHNVIPVIAITDARIDSSVTLLDGAPYASGTAVSGEGVHILSVWAHDRAGNTDSVRLTFHIDTTSPVISVSGVTDGSWYNTVVIPQISYNDANLDTAWALLNGLPFVSGYTVTNDGQYTLILHAQDKAGNTCRDTIGFGIDQIAPVITISGVADNGLYNHGVTPVVTVQEPHPASTTITLDGIPFVSGTEVSAEGQYVLAVTAADLAGNTSSSSVQFTIDTTPPAPPVMTNPAEDATVPASPIAVSGMAEAGCTVVLGVAGQSYQTAVSPAGVFQFPAAVLNTGLNLLTFVASDAAGNASRAAVYHVTLETGSGPQVDARMGVASGVQILCLAPVDCHSGHYWQDDRRFVEKALDGTGIHYAMATDPAGFLSEMRKGRYNLYMVFGDINLSLGLASDEIRERVNKGDGLIVVGDHFLESFNLSDVLGVKFGGALPQRDYNLIMIQSPVSNPDTLPYTGWIRLVTPTTGQVVGTVKLAPGAKAINRALDITWDEPSLDSRAALQAEYAKCPTQDVWNAAVINSYGQGKIALYTFDLGDTLNNYPEYREILLRSIAYCAPETTLSGPMATVPLAVNVANTGAPGAFKTIEAVPTDVKIDTAFNCGQVGSQTITWMYNLDQSDTISLESWVRLPDQQGIYLVTAETKALITGSYQTVDTVSIGLPVDRTGLQLIDQAIAMLDSLSLSGADNAHRKNAQRELNEARNRPVTGRSDLEKGIGNFLAAVKYVNKISKDTRAIRLVIDDALAVWQARWAWW